MSNSSQRVPLAGDQVLKQMGLWELCSFKPLHCSLTSDNTFAICGILRKYLFCHVIYWYNSQDIRIIILIRKQIKYMYFVQVFTNSSPFWHLICVRGADRRKVKCEPKGLIGGDIGLWWPIEKIKKRWWEFGLLKGNTMRSAWASGMWGTYLIERVPSEYSKWHS